MILCLETATPICSVAICDRNGVVALRESGEGRSHASLLSLYVEELLKETGVKAGQLDAVAVSKGPGSYTGLRIGVSTGKGIAYAASIPLISVDTTLSMFYGFLENAKTKYDINPSDLFCPLLDARRMEVYYSIFNADGRYFRSIRAEIIDKKSFSDLAEPARIFFFGDGVTKCIQVIERKNIVTDETFKISASFMHKPAYEALENNSFEDIAYFEPFYLKDFLAIKPVKNILGQ
jgi:tRNA threonylcarbamoyladenosine biosynthesis protein TsaB